MTPTLVQVDKARKALAKNMKDANAKFRAANPGYADIALDADDVKVIAGLAIYDDGHDMSQDTAMTLAGVRKDYLLAGRDTATLDLLSIKSEKNIPVSDKFQMTPYLAAKRYTVGGKVWKQGYQDPAAADIETRNSFIAGDKDRFQVLRAKGLFQLMTDEEIDDFVKSFPIGADDYFQLCL